MAENILNADTVMPVDRASPLDLPAGKPVGAAVQTVRLITYASSMRRPWSAAQAAGALGMNPSTCFNLVQTLTAMGWLDSVQTESRSRRYMLGSEFMNLLHGLAVRKVDLHDLMPYLQEFADRWKVTATIWHRQSLTRMELVAISSCQTAINVQMPIGQRLPILVGGMGRVLALRAGLDDALRRQIFESIRWDRTLSFDQFMAQARKARRIGWGIDDGFMNRAVTALAVAVNDKSRTPDDLSDEQSDWNDTEYVCSATMFRHQYASAVLPEVAESLKVVAARAAKVIYGRA